MGTPPALYFCYDGVCGATTTTGANDGNAQAAINSIVDDNGVAILTGHTTTVDLSGDDFFKVILPIGKSCDGLELRAKTKGSVSSIEKTVDKHNNGKVFKITRSFVQIEEADAADSSSDVDKDGATLAAKKGHSAVAAVSTLVISESASSCNVRAATDYAFPVLRPVSPTHPSAGATTVAFTHTDLADSAAYTNCAVSLRRYVITLDSMPTASATTVAKTLLYKSPVGSCNVAETTKGTFESYECSNRGACDGKSGLCACYEGYSGESCQTQTVLV